MVKFFVQRAVAPHGHSYLSLLRILYIYLINSGNINSRARDPVWGFFSFFERVSPISRDMNSMFWGKPQKSDVAL